MKKNSFLLILLLFIYSAANSQSLSGKVQVGGSFGYMVQQSENDFTGGYPRSSNDREFKILPQLGYFVNDFISIGMGIGYSGIKSESTYMGYDSWGGQSEQQIEVQVNTFNVGPYVRFHKPIGERAYVFGQVDVGFGFGTEKAENEDSGQKYENGISIFDFGIRPGFMYFLSDRIALEGSFGNLGYRQEKRKLESSGGGAESDQTNVSKVFGLDLGFSTLNLGVQWYF